MKLNKQIFNLMANLFGLQTGVDIKENESTAYSRKKCKSCDWYSQTQPMCNRYQRRTNPLDSACSKYIKRYRRGKWLWSDNMREYGLGEASSRPQSYRHQPPMAWGDGEAEAAQDSSLRGKKRFPSGIMDAYRAYLVLVGQEYGNRQMVVYLRTTPKAEEYCETK